MQHIQHILQLNWSHFKPEFSGIPEDAEAHLLRMNDWMDTHAFRRCESLKILSNISREAKLWYESLRPINVDWQGLQNQFRQEFSKIGNTREQLFHFCFMFSF